MRFKNIKVTNLYESMIRSGFPMETGEPKTLPESEYAVKAIAMNRYETAKRLGNAKPRSGHGNFLKGIHVAFDMEFSHVILPQLQRYHWFEIISSSSKMHRITKGKFSYSDFTLGESTKVSFNLIEAYNDFDNLVETNDCSITKDKEQYYICINSLDGTVSNPSEYPETYVELSKKELFESIVHNTPMGLQMWMGIDTNYLQLQNMYYQRQYHKLTEWQDFIKFCDELPMFKELCLEKGL